MHFSLAHTNVVVYSLDMEAMMILFAADRAAETMRGKIQRGIIPANFGRWSFTGKAGCVRKTGEPSAEFRTAADERVWVTESGEVIEEDMDATMAKTINTMAELAAASAVAAFGKDAPPNARTAYSFVLQLQHDNETEPEFPRLTGLQFRRFRHQYGQWLLNSGVRIDVAYKAASR